MYQKYFFYDISYIYDLCQIFGPSHLNFIHCPYNGVLLFYNITHRREFENIQKIAKNIEAEIKDNGNIKAVEKSSGNVTTKDLFMALDYFNYFSDKLAVQYLKDNNDDNGDFNIDDWSFLATLCQV